FLGAFDFHAERAHRLHGPQTIVAREKASQHAWTIAHRRNDDCAMRYAFVTRNSQFRVNDRHRANFPIRHRYLGKRMVSRWVFARLRKAWRSPAGADWSSSFTVCPSFSIIASPARRTAS